MPVLNNTEQHRTIMSNCLKFINQVELIEVANLSSSIFIRESEFTFLGTNFPEIGKLLVFPLWKF